MIIYVYTQHLTFSEIRGITSIYSLGTSSSSIPLQRCSRGTISKAFFESTKQQYKTFLSQATLFQQCLKGDKVIDGAMVFLKVNSSLTTLTIFFNPCTSSSRSRKYNKDELTFTKCYSFEIYTLSYLKCFEMYPFHTWSTNKFLYITCMPYYDVQLTLFANISKGFPLYPHTITREMSCSENT